MGDGPYVVIDDEEMGLIVRGLGVMPNPSAIFARLNEQHAEIARLRTKCDVAIATNVKLRRDTDSLRRKVEAVEKWIEGLRPSGWAMYGRVLHQKMVFAEKGSAPPR